MQTDSGKNISIIAIVGNPFVFIGIIALSAALLLSVVSEYTKETVKSNKELDKKKNILLARYFIEAKDENNDTIARLSNPKELMDIYNSEIEELLFLDGTSNVSSVITLSFNFAPPDLNNLLASAPEDKLKAFFKIKNIGRPLAILFLGISTVVKESP